MITCSACGYDQNPDGAEFCDACGSELQGVAPTVISSPQTPTVIQPQTPPPTSPPTPPPIPETRYPTPTPTPNPTLNSPSFPNTATTARLIAKQPNPPISEFPLDSNAIVGIFDPDTGPVEIDLEVFSGADTVSRSHGEIYQEGGVWKVKDLGSTNGIFIKRVGQTRFGARITIPETLNSGDEIAFAKVRFLFQSP